LRQALTIGGIPIAKPDPYTDAAEIIDAVLSSFEANKGRQRKIEELLRKHFPKDGAK